LRIKHKNQHHGFNSIRKSSPFLRGTAGKRNFVRGSWFVVVVSSAPPPRGGLSLETIWEGCHLGAIVIISIPWHGSEAGLGVHVAAICTFFVVFAAVVAAVGVAAGCV
jgi:hypothetical protein